MPDPLKRECDHSKGKVLPCANQGRKLDEYFDTMTHLGPWAHLCRECTMAHGYIRSSVTTRFVWDGVYGDYLKMRRVKAHDNHTE